MKRISCLLLLAVANPLLARSWSDPEPEPSSPAPPAAPAPALLPGAAIPPQTVTVTGSRANDMEQRRSSTAARQIYGREELERHGDSSVSEILKRLPGVTIGGRPGRRGEIRMRGLGNGYTQILLNGERPPPGFSLDALAPDQIERIEVIRGTIAEHSARAIAGTINIILREAYQQKETQLKLSDSMEQNRHRPNIALTVPGQDGMLNWLLSGTLGETHQFDASHTHNQDIDLRLAGAAALQKDQQLLEQSERRTQSLHLTPRLVFKFGKGDSLTLQPFLNSSRSQSRLQSELTQSIGSTPPEYARALGHTDAQSTMARAFGNWVHRIDGGGKFDLKFGFGSGHSSNHAERDQFNGAGTLLNHVIDSDSTLDRSATLGLKYQTALGTGHKLDTGWDAELGRREQTRVAQDNGDAQFDDSGANLSASTRRMAAFVQDEWEISPQWAAYLGVRWEGIRTESRRASDASGANPMAGSGQQVRNASSVWSPMLHGVWRIPGSTKDQVRASLTHSYKSPALNDLIAVPTLSRLNSATRPDRIGNPDLKPELAQGIDLAYEHYLGTSGIVSAGAFVRDIRQLIRRETRLRPGANGPRWVSMPVNLDHARTSGIELEAKLRLTELQPSAPNLDLRANYSHFWSHVDGIPGPDNRLAQQVRQTANLGLDYRSKSLPLTLGASLNWTPESVVRNSLTEVVSTGPKHQVDLYGLWKFSPTAQLRIGASNVLAEDYESGRTVTTDSLAQGATTLARTWPVWNIRLEFKL